MGKLLKIIILGTVFKLASSRLSAASGDVVENFEWSLLPVDKKSDLNISLQQGRVVGVINIRIKVTNRNAFNVYLKGYQAVISRKGKPLGSISTITNIELPSNEARIVSAKFNIPGTEFINELESLLGGGSLLTPITIDGQLDISDGFVLPLSQTIEFFKIS